MSNDPFDQLDRALKSGLSSLAPEIDGSGEALEALRPKFRRARLRSRAIKVGGSLMVVLAIGSAAALAAPRSPRTQVKVTSPSETTVEQPRKHPKPSTTTTPTTKKAVPTTTTTMVPPNTSGVQQWAHGHGSTTPAPPAVVTTPTAAPTTSGPKPTTPTTKPKPPALAPVQVFYSHGGRIEVRLTKGVLSLVRILPADGYRPHKWTMPTKIDVRFSKDGTDWWIHVRIVKGRATQVPGPTQAAGNDGNFYWGHQQYFQTPDPSRGVLSPFVPAPESGQPVPAPDAGQKDDDA